MDKTITIHASTFNQALGFIQQAMDKPDNKAAMTLGRLWLETLKGYLPIVCQCGQEIDTTSGGKPNSGIYCTGCDKVFCDNCYDTTKGDGCHCHPTVEKPSGS